MDDIFFKQPPETETVQSESPFYFRGQLEASGADVFCKVWREGDENSPPADAVEEEKNMLRIANAANVPSPTIFPELSATNICVDESKYHLIVMSFIDGVEFVRLRDVDVFAIQAVKHLHGSGVLHCDIKPSNILWVPSEQRAYLVDFGHAQLSTGAIAYRATIWFEAPEVVAGRSHTKETDAYAAGATLLAELQRMGVTRSHWLIPIPKQLMIDDVGERLTVMTRNGPGWQFKQFSKQKCIKQKWLEID